MFLTQSRSNQKRTRRTNRTEFTMPPTAGRKIVTCKMKQEILDIATGRQALGDSLKAVCRDHYVQPSQARRWRRLNDELKKSNPNTVSVNRGRASCLGEVGVDLLQLMFELREQGMPVLLRMVSLKASELDSNFRRKSILAKYASVRRFVCSHRFVIRIKTHVSQRHPSETQEEGLGFVKFMRPRVVGRHRDPDYVLNMYQTPIFSSMTPGTTLEQFGAISVNVRTSTISNMRVTLSVTITASVKTLTPMMVFKGKPSGIIQLGSPNYPQGCFYAFQDRAWMYEAVMLLWVDKVLKPYIQSAPAGIHPIILLDKYQCHMMASVVNKIQDLGCDV